MPSPFSGSPDLTICDLQEAKSWRRKRRFTFAIQILGASEEYGHESFPNVAMIPLRLMFEDVLDGPEHFANPADYEGPTENDIRLIINVGRRWAREPASSMLIHCYAGRARSTAATLIALVAAGMSPEEAGVVLCEKKPDAYPNILMAKMADEILGSSGAILAVAKEICRPEDEKEY